MPDYFRTILKLMICFILTGITLTGLSGCGEDEAVEETEVIRPVKYYRINPRAMGSGLEYSGTVSAAQEVNIGFEVPGRIIQFPVKEGQKVKKGELLAALDPEDFQIALNARTAELNAAGADYKRLKELYENNNIAKRDFDVAEKNYEMAKASTESAQKAFNDTKLTAPFAGYIAQTLVKNFQNIQAKQPVLVLQDNSSLEVKVDIPEQDYAGVGKGLSLSRLTDILKPEIMVTSLPGKTFKAWFKEAATLADPATRTFEITLGFDAPASSSIAPGMTARLIITGSLDQDVKNILVPANALLSDDDGKSTVWIIDPESHRVKRQVVMPGEMTGSSIEILKGLNSEDIIAVSGVHQLREGVKVREYTKP